MRTATKRSYLTDDRKKLVPHGHKDAAFLFAIEGARMTPDQIDHLEGADEFFDAPAAKKSKEVAPTPVAKAKPTGSKKK